MSKEVVVSQEKLECLRGHLSAALAIMQELGIDLGDVVGRGPSPDRSQKLTKEDRIDKYSQQLSYGSKRFGRRAG
jgi:hypothetical protein